MPLLDELRAAGVDIKFSPSREDEIRICCPFCVEMETSPDTKYRCGINLMSGQGHCFNCNWKSHKALLEIIRVYGLNPSLKDEVHTHGETRRRAKPVLLPEDFQLLADLEEDDDLYAGAMRYCFKRGMTRRQLREHEVGTSVLDWKTEHRIIFPVRNAEGLLLGYQARDYTGTKHIKAVNSEGTKAVWNCKKPKHSDKLGILSEGIFKALAIERAIGYRYLSSASLGSYGITDESIGYLKGLKELILFPDPDVVGMQGYINISVKYNSHFEKISMIRPWPNKQADDMTPEEIREYLRNREVCGFGLRMQLKLEMGNR